MTYDEIEELTKLLMALAKRVVTIAPVEKDKVAKPGEESEPDEFIITERPLPLPFDDYIYVTYDSIKMRLKPEVIEKLHAHKLNDGTVIFRLSFKDFMTTFETIVKSHSFEKIYNELYYMVTQQAMLPIANTLSSLKNQRYPDLPPEEIVSRMKTEHLTRVVGAAWSPKTETIQMYLTKDLLKTSNLVKYKRMAYNQLVDYALFIKGKRDYVYIYKYSDGENSRILKIFERAGNLRFIDDFFNENAFTFEEANAIPLDDLVVMCDELRAVTEDIKKAEKEGTLNK